MQFHVRPGNEMQPGELGYAWMPLARNAARQRRNGLGQYAAAAMMAAQAYQESQKDDGGTETEQNPGMPGREQSSPRQPSAVTTISPTIQASISPQISPVMNQVQSSPGTSISANPMQYMPGGMRGSGGGSAVSPYGNYAAPGMPSGLPGQPYGEGFPPQMPYTFDPMTGTYRAMPADQYAPTSYTQAGGAGSPISIGESRMMDIPWMPIAIVGGVAALAFLWPKRKKAA